MKAIYRFKTIREVLTVGFALLIFLLISAGIVGWVSMTRMADEVSLTLAEAQLGCPAGVGFLECGDTGNSSGEYLSERSGRQVGPGVPPPWLGSAQAPPQLRLAP